MAAGTQVSELRELNNEELVVKLREAKEELFKLRFQAATGQLENNSRLKVARKDIARIYTLMRERELGIDTVVSPTAESADEVAEESGPAEAVEKS